MCSASIYAHGVETIAHRGSSGNAPENTIAAIQKAVDQNSNYIEIDVHMSKDGHIIVFHDEKLSRTTNGTGKIKNKTLIELKKLDAGSWFSERYKNEKIPTLKEILELDLKNSVLIIEVKNIDNVYNGIEEKIVKIIKSSPFMGKVIYKSFGTEVLERFHQLDSKREILYVTIGPIFNWLLIDDWLRVGSVFDLKISDYIQVHRYLITNKLIVKAHNLGKKIIAWDVNSQKDINKMVMLGVDIIETDFPERVLNLK